MSSSPKPFRKNVSGQVLQSVMLVTIVSGIVVWMGTMVGFLSKTSRAKTEQTRATLQNSAAVETFLVAYRVAEAKYAEAVEGCSTANVFIAALKQGTGCSTVTSLDLFNGSDGGVTDGLYTYQTPCHLTETTSSCASGGVKLLTVSFGTDVRGLASSTSYDFYINNVLPSRQIIEFMAHYSEITNNERKTKFGFAVRASLPNAAHLEADGRVTQENPDPLAFCKGTAWADFLLYDPSARTCTRFAQLGGGTGLAFYNNRFFGFRPADGQVIDLTAATDPANTSYMVGEDGKTTPTSAAIFPEYDKSLHVNVDDITVIGDQIYYVALSGAEAQIGVLQKVSGVFQRVEVCDLGGKGWGQAYEGIAAIASSTPLVAKTGDGLTSRLATFYLKTSGSDLLTAVVRGGATGAPYTCSVFKDSTLQQIEYARTNGFDRTDSTKPYYIY